ncbi:MAG: hypothetical protein ACYSR9_06870 [Planctomycetota bacterium]|jgi:hypothetical protein
MEILVYEDNTEKNYQTVAVIDWKNLDKKVKERPEDYVFILSPDEMDKFIELNKQIYAGLKGKDMAINEAEYISQYQGVFAIAALAVQPDFVQKFKVGHFTHKILGASHAVFYMNRSTNDTERSNAVLKRIIDFKANATKEGNKNN